MPCDFRLVDAHCHLDLFQDIPTLLRHVEGARVLTLAVTTAPSFYHRCVHLARGSRFVRVAAGLHPELVAERASELPALLNLIRSTRWVGEVGLDFTDSRKHVRAHQVSIFSEIVSLCAELGDHVLSVHSRRAAQETMEVIGGGFPGVVILHWYSGPAGLVARAVANGFYFSVNTSMLCSKSGRRIVERIPRERLLTETDGPFTRVEGRQAEPGDVIRAVENLSRCWAETTDVVERILRENAVRALGIGEFPRQEESRRLTS